MLHRRPVEAGSTVSTHPASFTRQPGVGKYVQWRHASLMCTDRLLLTLAGKMSQPNIIEISGMGNRPDQDIGGLNGERGSSLNGLTQLPRF